MGKMLEGIKVLDLSMYVPGPCCTQLLSDLGAEVIKIEPAGNGDPCRVLPFFDQFNRGKKSVMINLKNHAGVEAFLKLAEKADVIVEGFRPGVVNKFGIGYDDVRKVNDKIVYCSISSFGQNGPLRDTVAHDINSIGMTGIQDLLRAENGMPVIPAITISDISSGILSAMGIVSALWQRTKKNIGQYLDMSMYESCFVFQQSLFGYLLEGDEFGAGKGPFNGGTACYNQYKTADEKYITIGAHEGHFWAGICKLTGKEHLINLQYALGKEGEKVKQEMQELFLTKTLAEWIKILGHHGLCVTPVLSLKEAIEEPHAKYRRVIISNTTNESVLRQLNCPIKGPGIDEPIVRPGPKLGEHVTEVFKEIGMDKEQIEKFFEAGAFRL